MTGLLIALVSITGLQFFVIVALFSDMNEIKHALNRKIAAAKAMGKVLNFRGEK